MVQPFHERFFIHINSTHWNVSNTKSIPFEAQWYFPSCTIFSLWPCFGSCYSVPETSWTGSRSRVLLSLLTVLVAKPRPTRWYTHYEHATPTCTILHYLQLVLVASLLNINLHVYLLRKMTYMLNKRDKMYCWLTVLGMFWRNKKKLKLLWLKLILADASYIYLYLYHIYIYILHRIVSVIN